MTSTPVSIDPRHTALVVMDFQQGILANLNDADKLLTRVRDAIETVRLQGGKIAYVRVALADADIDRLPAHSPLAARVAAAPQLLHVDSPTTAIDDRIAPQAGDIAVRKSRTGAFSTTDLDRQLREAGITTLILAGVATSGCVLSTVRDGADRDYQLLILADACADPAPEVHRFLIERIFPRQARVVTIEELAELLAGEKT